MKYNKVRNIINAILFESAYNIGLREDKDAGREQATIPEELPVDPDNNVGLNSVVSRPPVEDEEYIPKTPSELSAAVKALSELLGSDDIARVYGLIKKSIENPESSQSIKEAYDDYDDYGSYSGDIPDDSDMPEEFRQGYSIEEPEEDPEETASSRDKFKASKSSGEASLSDLVKTGLMPGVSGESGAKQWIGRKQKKLAALKMFDKNQVSQVKNYARDIWVGALEATESVNSEEAQALKKSSYTLTNPAFLSFLNMGFLEPAIKPIKVQRDREVKKEMSSLDFPPQVQNMIFSQTVGLSPKSHRKLRLKLNKEFPDMKLEEMDELVEKARSFINSNSEKYQKDFFAEVDFFNSAKDAWSRKSTDEKMDITFAAIDDSEDFQSRAEDLGLR